MIRAVIFDFGGVICAFDNDIFLRKLLAHTDRSFPELKNALYASDLPVRYESGRITSEEFFREAAERGRLAVSREEFFDAFSSIFTPLPGTFRLIRGLKGRYRIGLLSNTNEHHFESYIRTVEVFPLFDSVTLSYDVKMMKPDEGIYRDALRKLRVPPGECMYIDDIEANVEGANRLGLQGIRYVSHDGLLSSLGAAGVRLPDGG
jgi:putative hydrolase of the HAD superfamily